MCGDLCSKFWWLSIWGKVLRASLGWSTGFYRVDKARGHDYLEWPSASLIERDGGGVNRKKRYVRDIVWWKSHYIVRVALCFHVCYSMISTVIFLQCNLLAHLWLCIIFVKCAFCVICTMCTVSAEKFGASITFPQCGCFEANLRRQILT